MLRYSWKKIHRFTGGSSKRVTHVLEALVLKKLGGYPESHYSVLYEPFINNFDGISFLINPYTLVSHRRRWKYKEIAQYVALASFRSHAYYATTADASLDLLHSPVKEDIINNNRLLTIRDGRVHFLYEEVTKEK